VEKKSADYVIESVKNTFSLAILGRSIGAGKTKEDPIGCEKGCCGIVHKFYAVICLEALNGQRELGASKGTKLN